MNSGIDSEYKIGLKIASDEEKCVYQVIASAHSSFFQAIVYSYLAKVNEILAGAFYL